MLGYFLGIFVVALFAFSAFLTWKIFIAKDKKPEEHNSVVVSRVEVMAWLGHFLSREHKGRVISEETSMTQVEVIVALIFANNKYDLSLDLHDGFCRLQFKGKNIVECSVKREGIKTVGDFLEVLGKGFNWPQNKPKSEAVGG